MKKKMSAICSLPEELWENIFTKVSVKSVRHCRCVCRTWRKVLTSSYFIKLHVDQGKERSPNLMLSSYTFMECKGIEFGACDEPVNSDLDSPYKVGSEIIGSSNGVLCLSNRKNSICLWNPATRERLELPSLHPPHSLCMGFGGFGCDLDSKIYKVVIVSAGNHHGSSVFTLGTNSWRMLEDTPSRSCFADAYIKGVHVNGVLHWAVSREYQFSRSIISFGVRNEKFGKIPWPNFNDSNTSYLTLGVLDGYLATFRNFINEHVDIWLMKDYGVKESWNKLYSVGRPAVLSQFLLLEPLCILKNGKILLVMNDRTVILFDPGHMRATFPSMHGMPSPFHAITYVESFTSIAALMGSNKVHGPEAHSQMGTGK